MEKTLKNPTRKSQKNHSKKDPKSPPFTHFSPLWSHLWIFFESEILKSPTCPPPTPILAAKWATFTHRDSPGVQIFDNCDSIH